MFFWYLKRWDSAVSPKNGHHFSNKLFQNWNYKKKITKNVVLNWYFSIKENGKIQAFFATIDFECPNFMIFDATVPSQRYRFQKTILQRLIFLVKMELVSSVLHINATTLIWLLRGTPLHSHAWTSPKFPLAALGISKGKRIIWETQYFFFRPDRDKNSLHFYYTCI